MHFFFVSGIWGNMKKANNRISGLTVNKMISLLAALALLAAVCSSCSGESTQTPVNDDSAETVDTSGYLVVTGNEPDTVDFQCTSLYYLTAYNSVDRLVETQSGDDGTPVIVPSLAESWDVSDDGTEYTFHLREGIEFSNGSALTSSDVLYTFTRLLTHPDSCNGELVAEIAGAPQLMSGEADTLNGFEIINDTDFTITLAKPFEAFLLCLSVPGASILDEETTERAGELFGKGPDNIIGTGPYIMYRWEHGDRMLFRVNENWWGGSPANDGLDVRFITDAETERIMFEDGEIDILDLDDLGDSAEFFIHGDIYQNRLYDVDRTAISYIALNESVGPLNDVRVRKALQYSLDRQLLLDAVYGGRGVVENGIYPHSLIGFDPDLPEIPYDKDRAAALLAEAGYPDGFTLEVGMRPTSTAYEVSLVRAAASMWKEIGIETDINVMSENEFMKKRTEGSLACYLGTWAADYYDPDNFIYTFFGSAEKTKYRSLCYSDESVMRRVRDARSMLDEEERIKEYRDLERKIIQDDAAWIPLFSRTRYYVTNSRVSGFRTDWNGYIEECYKYYSVEPMQQ